MAAASHTHQTLTPQLFLHVCDHFLNKSSSVFSSQGTVRLLISLPQKRKLYFVVNDRNRVENKKSKTCSFSFQARLDFMSSFIQTKFSSRS